MRNVVTISPKFQVVIPKQVREEMNLVPGQLVHVIGFGDRIEFLPVRDPRELRGTLAGMDIGPVREEEDRL